MKKQKFFHLTFNFYNFDYSFGRNVIEDLLIDKFSIKIDDGGYKKAGGVRLAEMFKRQFPNVNEIFLCKLDFMPEHKEDWSVNLDKYAILKIA